MNTIDACHDVKACSTDRDVRSACDRTCSWPDSSELGYFVKEVRDGFGGLAVRPCYRAPVPCSAGIDADVHLDTLLS